jgi:hypothetical protein
MIRRILGALIVAIAVIAILVWIVDGGVGHVKSTFTNFKNPIAFFQGLGSSASLGGIFQLPFDVPLPSVSDTGDSSGINNLQSNENADTGDQDQLNNLQNQYDTLNAQSQPNTSLAIALGAYAYIKNQSGGTARVTLNSVDTSSGEAGLTFAYCPSTGCEQPYVANLALITGEPQEIDGFTMTLVTVSRSGVTIMAQPQ